MSEDSDSTMVEAAIQRLNQHAVGTLAMEKSSVLADYMDLLKNGGRPFGLDTIRADIFDQLELINRAVNDESAEPSATKNLPRSLVYAVSGMITQCVNYLAVSRNQDEVNREIMRLCWEINYAWEALVAGDIYDIREHIVLESIRFDS